MQIKANGISINYAIDGREGATSDAPWLVLSNSLATDLSMWDQQAKDFSSSFRVLRYDQRGHGKTEAPAGGYTFDMLIADAVALMDTLKIARAHFATVYAKPMGRPMVDTFVTEVSQDTWIYFPWDLGLSFQPPIRNGEPK